MSGGRFPSNVQNSPRPSAVAMAVVICLTDAKDGAGVDCACLDDFGQYWRSSGGGTARSELSDPPNGVSQLGLKSQLGSFISNSALEV